MAVTLDQFHQFLIEEKSLVDDSFCFAGSFKTMPQTYESWVGYLFSANGGFCRGRFVSCSGSARFTFRPQRPDQMELEMGLPYYYLYGYWGEKATLVLDTNCRLARTEFKPRDAFESDWSPRDGAHFWGPANQHQGEPGRIIPEGWSREHCSICWAKISQYAQKHSYRSQGEIGEIWVCESRYIRHISAKNLDFITNT